MLRGFCDKVKSWIHLLHILYFFGRNPQVINEIMEIFGFFSKDFEINSHSHGLFMYTYFKLFDFNASDVLQHLLNIKMKGVFDTKWVFK